MVQQIPLKGLHKVSMTLKDGRKASYYYAWRGGPPMVADDGSKPDFGTPAFLALFAKLTAPPEKAPVFGDIITKFRAAPEYTGLKPNTQASYERCLKAIEAKFGDMPLHFMASPAVRGGFKDWRNSIAAEGKKAKADYSWAVLARVCSFAVDQGIVERNPCLNGGRLYKSDRQEMVWTEEDLLRLYDVASPEVSAVVIFALWTGQRMSDCLKTKWSDMEVGRIKVRQDKRGARIMIPVGKALGDLLAKLPRTEAGTILTNSRGQAWTTDGYQTSYGRAFARAGIVSGVHFHDLRGTAITRMALAGCTAVQIAAVTGHAIKSVQEIMDNHYLGGIAELAEQAIAKLEAHRG